MIFSYTLFVAAPTVAALRAVGDLRTGAKDYEHIKWDNGKCVYWGNKEWEAEATMTNGLETLLIYQKDESKWIDIDVKGRNLTASSPDLGRATLCSRSSTKCMSTFPDNLEKVEEELKALTAKTYEDCKRVFKLIFDNPPEGYQKGPGWLGEFLKTSIEKVKALPHMRKVQNQRTFPIPRK
ncbi:hypothetical protein FOL47_007285 [Perkinsus chesapeaki]|uniref:Uncharacterized protein n=1 Tax=Perkinsus chesapeaki TaxID=330153 RepID=A0A7J6LLK6_PERCH|nr:hypothetical protein FOL47_007285 [Perkinsus chesapeaki]